MVSQKILYNLKVSEYIFIEGDGTMASRYIKLCEDATEDALEAFPVNEFPDEYEHAKNMYKLLSQTSQL